MVKIIKIIGRGLGVILEWLVIFVILFAFGIRTSPVQTFLAKKATNYLSTELKATVQIDRVSIIFPNEVSLRGVLIEDLEGDTLIAANEIYVSIADYNLKNYYFRIGNAEVSQATIHLNRDKLGVFNYQFIRDYFSPKKKKKKINFTLLADKVYVNNSKFKYNDDRHQGRTTGLDYFHIDASQIDAHVDNFKIENQVYSGEIKSVNCYEKSGFVLSDLQVKTEVHSEGVFLSDVTIKTPGSRIKSSKFNMLSTGFTDFKTFVDSVAFDATIDKSTIDLKEAALFAYILDGMNDTIQVKTKISRKIPKLKLSKLDLRIKEKSCIRGTINLPDYRSPKNSFFHEKIDYLKLDINELKSIRLPDESKTRYLEIDESIKQLTFFEAEDIRIDGFYSQFVIASDIISTNLGAVRMDNGVMFTRNEKNNSYLFERSGSSTYDVKIEEFNLGKLIGNKDVGIIDGLFFLSGEAFSTKDIRFSSIEGNVNKFEYLNYPYQHITVLDGSFANKIFEGVIDVKDDNLDMTYKGLIDFRGELHMIFEIDVKEALLNNLNISEKNSRITSTFRADLKGKDPNSFRGSLDMDGFTLTENNKTFNIPSLKMNIIRGLEQDEFDVKSQLIDFNLKGKIDIDRVLDKLSAQLNRVFPKLFKPNLNTKTSKFLDHYEFEALVKQSTDFLSVFVPGLTIANRTKLTGRFYEESSNFVLHLNSDSIHYNDLFFSGIEFHQVMDKNSIVATYNTDNFTFKDSINFEDVYFKTVGKDNKLTSNLTWEQKKPSASSIHWETNIEDYNHFKVLIEPSYFTISENKWEIAHMSQVRFAADTIDVKDFILLRDNQSISIDGFLSDMDQHHLNFNIKDLELEEISSFISKVPIEGKLNAYGYFSNPYNNFTYSGKADIYQLKLKSRLVGDININSDWIKNNQSIALQGDLNYRGNQTFDFIGDYYPRRKTENLDFNLFFDYTDIQFTNAFMNPEVLSDIKGLLNGTLKVSGTPDKPIVDGVVELVAGSARVDILGTHFGLEGPIEVDEYGFYVNGIPVYDEDGNAGLVIGSVYHDNFADFNFDVMFDLEDDGFNKDPLKPWMVLPLDRFLVLNSAYEPGSLYNGIGYATGFVNVFGYTDNLEITVDLKTRKGTKIEVPMYGVGEIENENNFIVFVDKDTTIQYVEPKIDFTGVDLDLNFSVTPEAELKIIFNEELEDEITAHGSGDISIKLNNIGDITMDGIFTVQDGVYDFAMGPVKQKFFIEKGGNITWLGDPYTAILDLRTFYKVHTNIATLTNDQFGTGSGSRQEILCFLDLTESLTKPTIKFDIDAPGVNEESKAIINRIKNDRDEMNRQFFSLLLWKRFQPLTGNVSADGSAAIDLVTNQINAMLSKVSTDYVLNVNVNSDQLSGESTYEFGVSKGFLNDRLILSGSFGVENYKIDEESEENSIIGDVKLEYLLNKAGTFRVDIFNESNDKSVIQSQEQGRFTQGAGLNYKEDFHTAKDFKALQYFLDVFRKKKNKRYPIKRKRQQVPIPQNIPDPDKSSD